jgi:Flp pilus assembly protein TadG
MRNNGIIAQRSRRLENADTLSMIGKLAKYFRRRGGDISRFGNARQGATAVEFALIAPAFLATLIAVLETCLFLFAQMALQNAAMEVGRQFMTGQAQNAGWTTSTIQSNVCALPNFPSVLFTCSKIGVIVQTYASFAAANTSAPTLTFNAQGQVTNTWAYDPGTQNEIMVVQLVYPWSVVGGLLGFTLSNLPIGAAELMGVTSFRVEPY